MKIGVGPGLTCEVSLLTSHRWLLNVFKDPPTVEKHETVRYQLGRCWVYQRESLPLCIQRSLWRFVRQFECQVWDGMTHPLRSEKKRERVTLPSSSSSQWPCLPPSPGSLSHSLWTLSGIWFLRILSQCPRTPGSRVVCGLGSWGQHNGAPPHCPLILGLVGALWVLDHCGKHSVAPGCS